MRTKQIENRTYRGGVEVGIKCSIRKILEIALICAFSMRVCPATSASKTAKEKQPSAWELLLRKQRGKGSRVVESPAKKPKSTSPRSQERVVHFPKDRSLGRLYIQDEETVGEFGYWFHWTRMGERSEYLCEAKGDVHVPAGKRLTLTISPTALRDLSPLTKLRPDDLYGAVFDTSPRYPTKGTDECMPYIAHLTGLRSLTLRQTNITDKGMSFIKNLKSLEHLIIPDRVTNRGMTYVAELTSLKRLYFSEIGGLSEVTNTGLRYLAKLTNLEELALWGERVGDAGLAYIEDLPRLEYLFIRGSRFTDKGMIHVKNIPSLKILSFHEGVARITDAGLVHISEMPNLESLCLHGMRNITDDGLAHLSKMHSLKKLEIGSSQVTDRGLAYLTQIKTLERLDLPQRDQRITDIGLGHLGELANLKHLRISRSHYVDPKMNKEYYTDKSLAELAKCQLLEELHIGSIGITDAGMEHIAKLTNLTRLNMFGCDNVTNAGLAKLTALKSLTDLSVSYANISIAGLNNLKPMPNLTKLRLRNFRRDGAVLDISGLTNLEDVYLFFSQRSGDTFTNADLMCLADLSRLKWLQIGPRHLTDGGMAYLAGLTNMERLGIGGPHLTDEGLSYLANMKKLNHLTISDGDLTDRGLRHLEDLKSLRFLNITSANAFSNPALQRLRTNLPNLHTFRVMP